jgi:predicted transcriptional regulator
MEKQDAEQIIETLESIKKLLILEILDKGYSQKQVAMTLGVGQATVSRMFPKAVLGKKRD